MLSRFLIALTLIVSPFFCFSSDGGFPGGPPPSDPLDQIDYNNTVYQYLQTSLTKDSGYRTWTHDMYWRFTGKLTKAKVQIDRTGGNMTVTDKGPQFGVHPPCRIYYSPSVVAWMKNGYKGDIPDGAVIIKETAGWNQGVLDYAQSVEPQKRVELANAGKPITVTKVIKNPLTTSSWVVMVRNSKASLDGWYWFDFTVPSSATKEQPYNYSGLSAVTAGFEAMPKLPSSGWQKASTSPQPGTTDYWTGNATGTVVYPSYGYGYYCYNCHASAISNSTFSDYENVEGKVDPFPVTIYFQFPPENPIPTQAQHTLHKGDDEPLQSLAASQAANMYTPPLDHANQDFKGTFKKYTPWKQVTWEDAWNARLPARTYNHNVMSPDAKEQFLTSDQCQPCHDASMLNSTTPNMMMDKGERNISPFGEWEVSMMGLAGRDPIFYSQLEGETNYYPDHLTGFITNTCFKCHGVMGQRQFHLDGNKEDFTRAMAAAWPGSDNKDMTKYGGLARDGVSCTVCHHIVEDGLGTPETFTGNFKVGPPDEIYGPYDKVIPKPMEHSVGITPKYGAWMPTSKLCGSCHVVHLPVLKKDGKPVMEDGKPKYIYEQTTYLEWLNSDFNNEPYEPGGKANPQGQSCQDCHMKQTYEGQKIKTKIANIEESTATKDFPYMARALPNKDLTLTEHQPFYRHQLTGINLFGLELFSQFPLIAGIMQLDFQNYLKNSLYEAQQVMADMAQTESVTLDTTVSFDGDVLKADVTVNNLVGHFFPSGVGFRRAFLNVEVLDQQGGLIWASGNTNAVGVIVDDKDEPLPTEFLEEDKRIGLNYQPHYTEINHPYQVQIYETLHKDSAGNLTTSFLNLDHDVKDNRLRPKGWSPTGPYASETLAYGNAAKDPNYTDKDKTGKDHVLYAIKLTPDQKAKVGLVRVAVYYQATPPYYLMQRFQMAKLNPNSKFNDIKRFWFMASHLNTGDSQFIKNWKLLVQEEETPL